LFGVAPWDPLTISGVAALLLIVATSACLTPARRASKTDPLVSLRVGTQGGFHAITGYSLGSRNPCCRQDN
jgi:hypothetical protein